MPFNGLLFKVAKAQVAQARILRNIQNIRICMGKKPIVSVTYENERISIKKQLTLLKMCVSSLLCDPWADLWPFYGNNADAGRCSYFELGLPVAKLNFLSLCYLFYCFPPV